MVNIAVKIGSFRVYKANDQTELVFLFLVRLECHPDLCWTVGRGLVGNGMIIALV